MSKKDLDTIIMELFKSIVFQKKNLGKRCSAL
jgi:hypothetical protein